MRQLPLPDVTLVPAYFEKDGQRIEIPHQKAIINPVTNHVFALASDKYKLVRHEEVLANVESVIANSNTYGDYTRKISLDQEGAQMKATYKFGEMEIAVDKGDLINPTIEVFNSYNLTWRHTVMCGAYRMICSNGMVVGENFMTYKKRHMPDLYLEDVKYALEGGMVQMQMQTKQWQEWQHEEIKQPMVEDIMDKMKLNGKEKEGLMNTREVGSQIALQDWLKFTETSTAIVTRWIFFNIMTQFLTHAIKKEIRRTQLEAAFRKNIYR